MAGARLLYGADSACGNAHLFEYSSRTFFFRGSAGKCEAQNPKAIRSRASAWTAVISALLSCGRGPFDGSWRFVHAKAAEGRRTPGRSARFAGPFAVAPALELRWLQHRCRTGEGCWWLVDASCARKRCPSSLRRDGGQRHRPRGLSHRLNTTTCSTPVSSEAARALRNASSFSRAGGFEKVAAPETGALQNSATRVEPQAQHYNSSWISGIRTPAGFVSCRAPAQSHLRLNDSTLVLSK